MNREEIIRMAREVSSMQRLPWNGQWIFTTQKELLEFAALVAAAERQACKQICDRIEIERGPWGRQGHAGDCAAAIGAKGKA